MKVQRYFMLVMTLMFSVTSILAQERTITGNVTSVSDGVPLPGVSVVVRGTTRGVQTDFDGNYSIQASSNESLVFTYLGLKTQTIPIGNRTTINVAMEEDVESLEEVVVVAYGTSSKEALTGAVVQIRSEDITNRPVANISAALEGAAAGIIATASGGQPGSSQDIRIRGFSSFGADNDPLYVVDGIPTSGNLNNINPADIESISILKDASSTALYGNKAANGVVLITTKKGTNKKGEVSLNISTGVIDRAIPEYDRIDAFDYYPIMWESLRNSDAIPGVDSQANVDIANQDASDDIFGILGYNPFNVPNDQIVGLNGQLNPNASLLYDDFDWEDAVTRTGIRRNVDLSYLGGSENSDYFASLGYLKEDGYLINSDFERFTARVNVNANPTKWLKLGGNMAGTFSNGNQSQLGGSGSFRNAFRFTRGMGPIYPIYAHDPVTGAFILDENGNRVFDLDDNRPSGASTGRHVIVERLNDVDLDEITTLNFKAYMEFALAENLSFRTNLSYEDENLYTTFFWNKLIGDGAPDGLGFKQYIRTKRIGFNQLLNYDISFGDHNLEVLLGHESQELTIDDLNGTRTIQIADDNLELINFVTTTDLESVLDTETEDSYFGRVNYNFDNKYFLSASLRRDGSSRFAPDNRWGTFWSLGGSWSIEKEDFMDSADWVNQLKLRASFGEVGNKQGIGFFASQELFALGNNNQSEPGILRSSFGAADLQWEKVANYDVAVEFSLFNRLRGTLEYYNRESVDLIFDVPVAPSNGAPLNDDGDLPTLKQNIGTLVNKGIEVSLSYDIFNQEDFSWNLSVNATTLENEFTKLPQEEVINGTKKFTVGKGLFDYWIRDWYGVDPADGSGLYVADDPDATGVRTINGVAVTPFSSNAKFHYAGSVIPDVAGSFTNDIRFKQFSLRTLFVYQIGGKNLDLNYAGIMDAGSFGEAKHVDILNRWQQPGDITDVPRLDAALSSEWSAISDRWLIDSSFLNLRQVTLTYDFKSSVTDLIGVSALNIFASAENVFSINERKGFNVQQDFSGNTSNVFTPSRIVTFGLNLKL